MRNAVLVFAVIILAMGFALAQDAKPVYIEGTILEPAADGKSFTAKLDRPEAIDTIPVKMPENVEVKFYLYMPGTLEDLKDGVTVKVYGKVAEDKKSVAEVGSLAVIPEKSTHSGAGRIDGDWLAKDGKFYLQRGDETCEVQLKEGARVTVTAVCAADEIKPGVRFAGNAVKGEADYTISNEMRFFVERR